MTHRAESIVAAVVGKVTGLTTTGSRVFRGRVFPLQEADLPGLLVYLGPDKPVQMLSQDKIDGEVTVYVEARAKSPTAQIDTVLNTIREEVTIALQADYTQGLAYVINTVEGDADAPELSGDGNQPTGALRLEWRIHYRRSRTNPGA